MAILHKNITAAADIHNPKWFSGANSGDYAFKNEKGELESIDELLLPAALNFVDGSVAPPTTNSGDIYILSSGGSVNAGWGGVSLQDWVRYDGTAWNSITPQKSSLCYDKTADALKVFNGVSWAGIGGSIYSADDTIGTNRIATLTDTLSFKSGTLKIEGADTLGTSSALQIYDGDGTPSELLSVKNNGSFAVKNSLQTSLFLDGSNGRNSMGMGTITRSASFFTIRNAVNRPAILRLEDSSGYAISTFGLAVTFNNSADGQKRHIFASQSGVTKFEQYHTNVNVMAFRSNGTSFLTTGFKIGGTTRDASSILDLESTSSGFLPPRMTTTQRDLISSPASGLTLYNTTTNKLNVYTGSAWETISSS